MVVGSDVCVVCFGFWGFLFFGFCGRRWWFSVWGGLAMEDAMVFLGLEAMVWLGFMAGGGSSRSEVREGGGVLAVRIKGTTERRESRRAGL
nr:hypothetical protein CFP56_75522 [Quercus suber]